MIGAIIQVRMGSTRLPEKALMDICGKPALQRVIERVKLIRGIDKVCVATTTQSYDQPIGQLAVDTAVDLFQGSEPDVLDRYYKAAKSLGLDTIVRITADCPMLDPVVSSQVVSRFKNAPIGSVDYVSNVHPPTYPDGLDTEIFSFHALELDWRNAKSSFDREHVTPFIWQWPSPFRTANMWNTKDRSCLRWTLDTQQDLDWIRTIYEKIGKDIFGMNEVLALLDKEPDLVYTKERMV